jgi:hypothetical protein
MARYFSFCAKKMEGFKPAPDPQNSGRSHTMFGIRIWIRVRIRIGFALLDQDPFCIWLLYLLGMFYFMSY